MADLSAYVDFSLVLDNSNPLAPRVWVTDSYPSLPVGTAITGGAFTIQQPDGLQQSVVDGNPIILRMAADGQFQQGAYTFVRTLQATGYTDTVVTRSFALTYSPVTVSLTPLIDVFTPVVQLLDSTLYAVAGFNAPTITRQWTATVSYSGQQQAALSSTDPLLDFAVGGSYYDAAYSTRFAVTLTYVSSTAPWLSIKDSRTAALSFEVFTPPTLAALRSGIAHLAQKGACGCGCGDQEAFVKAQSLYDLFIASGKGGDLLATTYAYIPRMQRLINCGQYLLPAHTNAPIPAYNWELNSGAGSHDTVQFTVGSGATYVPVDGDTLYNNPTLKGIRPKSIFLQSIANFLTADQWQNQPLGGFRLLGGLTFNAGDKYTLTFDSAGGSAGSSNPFEIVLTDPATGKQIKITANTDDPTNPNVNYTFL